jgi:putative two-component system response regulator
VAGSTILSDILKKYNDEMPFLAYAVDIARHHHERYNGSGYPDNLSGDRIPVSARIVALADVYDALRSDRPYRQAVSHQSAVRIITTCSEGLFDPRLVHAFSKCEKELEEIFLNGVH